MLMDAFDAAIQSPTSFSMQNSRFVAEIINLPSDHVIGFMVAVGKAVKPAMPRAANRPCPKWWSRTGLPDTLPAIVCR
jgi:hypothetical protein